MAKKPTKPKKFAWMLRIEFTGLCAAEAFLADKEMMVYILDDPAHVPVLSARVRDVVNSLDCGPCHAMFFPDSTPRLSSTIGVWPIRRGAMVSVLDVNQHALKIPTVSIPPIGKKQNPSNIHMLPILNELLGANCVVMNSDDARFTLTDGAVTAGRCDLKRVWKIRVDGKERRKGPLAVTLIYTLKLEGANPVRLDLHPGTLSLHPPKKAKNRYTVEVTVSNLPTTRQTDDAVPHFNEYNRLVGTDADIEITEVTSIAYVEDPIHCFDAALIHVD